MTDPISLVVSPILNKVITTAMHLVTEEITLLIGVADQIKELSRVLEKIKNVLNDAEEKQISSPGLKLWLAELRDAAYDAEDTLDLFASKAHLWKREKKVLKWFQRTAALRVKELFERFKKINKEKEEFNLQVIMPDVGRNPFKDRPETGYFLDNLEVVGRKLDKEAIIEDLVTKFSNSPNNFDVISIIGIGGAGKTTLAQLVFNDPLISKHFDIYKMWVCVNVNFDLNRILREMIRYHSKMKNDDLNLSRSQLEARLEAFLTNNRFLLVLDDVWTENSDHWNSLKGILNLGASGSRILVTSRNNNVANMMSTGRESHRLSDLNEEEGWQLFSKCAFINSNIPERLEQIGRKIISKCNGLPLAIKALAGLLRGNHDVNMWNRILGNEIWELEKQYSEINNFKVLPALKLSFDHLPSYLKQCFLFCSIYPKGHSFVKSELVKIWIAEGFIPTHGKEKVEDTGNSYFDELLGRSFFIFSDVSRDKTYRMHDLIHDLALFITGPDYHQVIRETSSKIEENSRHISLLCENVTKPTLDLITTNKKVRTLLLPGGNLRGFGKIVDEWFSSLEFIRVLDLSSSSIDALPNSIQELHLLRYLDLSKTEIKTLPNSICKLQNLQTLRLLRCLSLSELPEDLGELTSLRHLELDDMFWHKLSRFPERAGRLKNLHNLQKFWVTHGKGNGVDQLQDLMSLSGTLHLLGIENVVNAKDAKLKEKKDILKVTLQWSKPDEGTPVNVESQETTLDELQPQSEVEELQMIHYRGSRLPPWIADGSLKMLTTVSLNHCINCKTLSFEELPNLTSLHLKGMHNLEECQGVQWPSLKILKINGCPNLRVLPNFMFGLFILKLKECNSLKVLPVTPFLRFLTLVDNAILENWNEVVVSFTFQDDQGQPRRCVQPSLASLLDVKLVRCPILKELPQFHPRKLDISSCDQLRGLPPLQYSENLKHLSLDTCNDGTLLSLMPITCPSLDSLVISNISTIKQLPNMPLFPGVKAFYIRGCKDLESLCDLHNLTSLKLLSIQNCPKLKSLPRSGLPTTLESLSIGSCTSLQDLGTLKTLTSLKDIYIQNCELIECLPGDGFPDSVRHLRIHGCPIIPERCDWSKIPDIETDVVKQASSSVSAASRLKKA